MWAAVIRDVDNEVTGEPLHTSGMNTVIALKYIFLSFGKWFRWIKHS